MRCVSPSPRSSSVRDTCTLSSDYPRLLFSGCGGCHRHAAVPPAAPPRARRRPDPQRERSGMGAPVRAARPSAGKADRRGCTAADTHGRAPHGVHGRCVRRSRRWHRPGTSIPIVLPIAAGLRWPGICRGQPSKPPDARNARARDTHARRAACPGIRVELSGPRPGERQHVGVDHRLPNGSGMDELSCACVTAAHAPSQDAWPCHFASVLPVTWADDPCHRAVQQSPPDSANRAA